MSMIIVGFNISFRLTVRVNVEGVLDMGVFIIKRKFIIINFDTIKFIFMNKAIFVVIIIINHIITKSVNLLLGLLCILVV